MTYSDTAPPEVWVVFSTAWKEVASTARTLTWIGAIWSIRWFSKSDPTTTGGALKAKGKGSWM